MSCCKLILELLILASLFVSRGGASPLKSDTSQKDGGYDLLEGDILLDNSTKQIIEILVARTQSTGPASVASDASTDPAKLWRHGRVPFQFGNVGTDVKRAFRDAVDEFKRRTCVRFIPRTSEKDYVRVISDRDRCWSPIGRSGGRQEMSLGRGCEYKGIAIHEMMHTLGFYHEQSRIDRDNYVIIKWENIRQGMAHNFQKYPRGRASSLGEPYDYGSIMHYGKRDFTKNGKPTIVKTRASSFKMGQRDGFSQIDINQVNKIYRCVDLDECAYLNNGGCEHHCYNTPKSYKCYCKAGYQLYNKHKCRDIDECSLQLCEHSCKNTIGSYICSCKAGYRLHPGGQHCQDIDECSIDNGECEHLCWNFPRGSYSCACRQGFLLKSDKKTCKDIDECALKNGGCDHFCQNSPGSFRCTCKHGYYLAIDGRTCRASNCGYLAVNNGGNVKCEEGVEGKESYKATCNVSCAVGYTTVGSTVRTCGADGRWTGNQTKCLLIRCPPLKKSRLLTIYPKNCASKHQLFNQYCVFTCKRGYRTIGSRYRRCTSSGHWDESKQPLCKDIESPLFKTSCPANIYRTTEPQKSYTTVLWAPPIAEDNSGEVALFTKPVGISSPYRFPIGDTKITYTAADPANSTASCSFTVNVQDTEKPQISCPPPLTITPDRPHVRVLWPQPNATDNSGELLQIESTVNPGVELTYGKYVITYRATDLSNNTRFCSFDIVIAKKRCKLFPKPVNGNRTCDGWRYGSFCTVSCNKGYKFATLPARLYVCGTNGQWFPNANPPPCSAA